MAAKPLCHGLRIINAHTNGYQNMATIQLYFQKLYTKFTYKPSSSNQPLIFGGFCLEFGKITPVHFCMAFWHCQKRTKTVVLFGSAESLACLLVYARTNKSHVSYLIITGLTYKIHLLLHSEKYYPIEDLDCSQTQNNLNNQVIP